MFVCIYVLHTLPRSGSSAHTGCLGEAAPRLRPAEESEPGLLTGHWIHQESLPFSRFPVTLNATPPTSPLPIHGPQRCPRGVQLVTEVFSVADLVPTDTVGFSCSYRNPSWSAGSAHSEIQCVFSLGRGSSEASFTSSLLVMIT